jgi:hypothetical protein
MVGSQALNRVQQPRQWTIAAPRILVVPESRVPTPVYAPGPWQGAEAGRCMATAIVSFSPSKHYAWTTRPQGNRVVLLGLENRRRFASRPLRPSAPTRAHTATLRCAPASPLPFTTVDAAATVVAVC